MEKKVVLTGFVVSHAAKGESGAILTILSSMGLYKAISTSGNKITGKNIPVGSLVGCLCDFDLAQKDENAPYMLRGVTIRKKYVDYSSNLLTSLYFMTTSETIAKLMFDDKDDEKSLYVVYRNCLEKLEESDNVLAVLSIFLSNSFEFLGFMPQTDGCVNCGKTSQIVSFSFEEGGFVCMSCANEIGLHGLERKLLLTYKYLFTTPIEDSTPWKIDSYILLSAVDSMVMFLKDDYGTRLESYKILKEELQRKAI